MLSTALHSIRPYNVSLSVTQVVTYVVDARTPEEAEATATSYLEDGELGEVSELLVLEADVEPTEDDSFNAPLIPGKFPRWNPGSDDEQPDPLD